MSMGLAQVELLQSGKLVVYLAQELAMPCDHARDVYTCLFLDPLLFPIRSACCGPDPDTGPYRGDCFPLSPGMHMLLSRY